MLRGVERRGVDRRPLHESHVLSGRRGRHSSGGCGCCRGGGANVEAQAVLAALQRVDGGFVMGVSEVELVMVVVVVEVARWRLGGQRERNRDAVIETVLETLQSAWSEHGRHLLADNGRQVEAGRLEFHIPLHNTTGFP